MVVTYQMPEGWEPCTLRDEIFRRFVETAKLHFERELRMVFEARDRGADVLFVADGETRFVRVACNVFLTRCAVMSFTYGISFGGYPKNCCLLDYPIPRKRVGNFVIVSDEILGFVHEYCFDVELDRDVELNYKETEAKIVPYVAEYGRRSFEKLATLRVFRG